MRQVLEAVEVLYDASLQFFQVLEAVEVLYDASLQFFHDQDAEDILDHCRIKINKKNDQHFRHVFWSTFRVSLAPFWEHFAFIFITFLDNFSETAIL